MSQHTVENRRSLRHRDTVDEVVGHALAVMGASGAAGLSLGEVARRMKMRTPSLYVYFPSKAALYDEVFARGWRSFGEAMQAYDGPLPEGTTLHQHVASAMGTCLEWAAAHPAYAQLMFWRPVPQWEPSPGSYAAAVSLAALTTRVFQRLRDDGHLRSDADAAEAADVFTVMVSGLVTQRLANEPTVPLASGRMTALVDPLVSAFTTHYESRPGHEHLHRYVPSPDA